MPKPSEKTDDFHCPFCGQDLISDEEIVQFKEILFRCVRCASKFYLSFNVKKCLVQLKVLACGEACNCC